MTMTAEQREQVATELKRFAVDLDLSEEQKEKLQTALADGRERVGEYLKSHPNTTKAEIVSKVKEHRSEIHERIAKFLDSEQLGKWDNEVAKARARSSTHKNTVPTINLWAASGNWRPAHLHGFYGCAWPPLERRAPSSQSTTPSVGVTSLRTRINARQTRAWIRRGLSCGPRRPGGDG